MNFLITSFFKELDRPFPLLASRGLVLDNPRTEEELQRLAMLLARASSMDGDHASMLPGLAVHTPWPYGLEAVRARTLGSVVDDRIPRDTALTLMEAVARAAAPQHVICRFDDQGAYEELTESRRGLPARSFILLHHDNPLLTRSWEAFEIGQLLALVACDEEAEGTLGDAFILDDTHDWSVSLGEKLTMALLNRCLISTEGRASTGFKFADFDHYSPRLAEAGRQLEIGSDRARPASRCSTRASSWRSPQGPETAESDSQSLLHCLSSY